MIQLGHRLIIVYTSTKYRDPVGLGSVVQPGFQSRGIAPFPLRLRLRLQRPIQDLQGAHEVNKGPSDVNRDQQTAPEGNTGRACPAR